MPIWSSVAPAFSSLATTKQRLHFARDALCVDNVASDPWVLPPPWERCREVCLHFESGVLIGTRGHQLPAHWRCRWVEGKNYGIAGRPGVTSGNGRMSKIVY
jgi:hypothetical protein